MRIILNNIFTLMIPVASIVVQKMTTKKKIVWNEKEKRKGNENVKTFKRAICIIKKKIKENEKCKDPK